jgi:hypothetical protein
MSSRSRRARARWLSVACVLICLNLARWTPAQLTQDQSFDPTGNVTVATSISGFNTTFERAQTFTVGVSGVLTHVDAYISHVVAPPAGNAVLDIRATMLDGSPDPALPPAGNLATAQAPIATAPLSPNAAFVSFELDQPVPVVAGQKLAMVLHSTLTTAPWGWHGSINNPYPGGEAYARQIGFNNSQWENQSAIINNFDLGFRTFVVIPEPTCAAISLLLALCSVARRPTGKAHRGGGE